MLLDGVVDVVVWVVVVFQWAPTLGGECYTYTLVLILANAVWFSFNGHPPLGVNATA